MLPRVNAEGIEDDAGALGRDLTLECGPDVILKSGLYMRGQFIGKASRDTGPSIDTIRFYEKVGLIEHPARTSGEFRIFGVRDTRELHLIRKMLKLMAVHCRLGQDGGAQRPCPYRFHAHRYSPLTLPLPRRCARDVQDREPGRILELAAPHYSRIWPCTAHC